MPSTKSTLRDAFARAPQAGSALDRAITGFSTVDPEERAPESKGRGFVDIFKGIDNTVADIFRGIVPQQARDVGGAVAQTAISGEEFGNFLSDLFANIPGGFGEAFEGRQSGTRIRQAAGQVPLLGGVLDDIFDIAAAPATGGIAAAGGAVAGAARAVPVVGRAAGALLDPILQSPNFLGRLAGETGFGLLAETGGQFAVGRLPEDTPYPIQVGVALSAGLLAGGGGVAGFRGIENLIKSANPAATLATERLGLSRVDELVAERTAEIEGVEGAGSIFGNLPLQARQQLASVMGSLGNNAQQMRSNALRNSARGNAPPTPVNPNFAAATDTFIHQIINPTAFTERGRVLRGNLNGLPPATLNQTSRFDFPRRLGRVFNAKLGRNPRGLMIADIYKTITNADEVSIGNFNRAVREEGREVIGQSFEKVSPLPAPKLAADAARHSRLVKWWRMLTSAQEQGANVRASLFSLLAENFDLFDLTDDQLSLVQRMSDFLDDDLAFSQSIGVKVEPVKGIYTRHALEFTDAATGKIVSRPDVNLAFARLLGDRRGFQMPRTFDTMLDLLDASSTQRDPQRWRNIVNVLVANATRAGDDVEARRLRALADSDFGIRPAQMDWEDAVSVRLIESSKARMETAALKEAKRHGRAVEEEMLRLLETQDIHGLVKIGAQIASVPRDIILRMDFSMPLIQGIGRLAIGYGFDKAAVREAGTLLRTISSDDEFLKYNMMEADSIADSARHGTVYSSNVINQAIEGADLDPVFNAFRHKFRKDVIDPITGDKLRLGGKPVQTEGLDINVPGKFVRWLEKAQFTRGIAVMKHQVWKYFTEMAFASGRSPALRALLSGHPSYAAFLKTANPDPEAVKVGVSNFVNDLFGGRDRVRLGRSQQHNMVEQIFLLTPGFTRGTLNLVMRGLTDFKSAEGALARDFFLRGTALAASLVTLLTVASNGLTDGEFVMPNLTDPGKRDWFDIVLPGGRRISPMTRFRSLAEISFRAAVDATTGKSLTDTAKSLTEDGLRWASYRQSALVSAGVGDPIGALGQQVGLNTGNSFARDLSVWDTITNPTTDRMADVQDAALQHITPITIQAIVEAAEANSGLTPRALADSMLIVGTEFLGTGVFAPTVLERKVADAVHDRAVAAGVPAETADSLTRIGESALNAKDENDRFFLTAEQRREIAKEVSTEIGIEESWVFRGGTVPRRERVTALEAMERQQLDTFFSGMKRVNDFYLNGNPETGQPGVKTLESAVQQGVLTPRQFSEEITKLRLQRRAAREHLEAASPAAVAFLDSDKHRENRNAKDVLFDAITAEAFDGGDFYDPLTLTFNFDLMEQNLARVQQRFPGVFDEWQDQREAKKTPLERERDAAFDRMTTYFAVADEIWFTTTGGMFGESAWDFDRQIHQMLRQSQPDMDDMTMAFMATVIKQSMPQVALADRYTQQVREIMRLTDPQLEQDVVRWLGSQPILARQF